MFLTNRRSPAESDTSAPLRECAVGRGPAPAAGRFCIVHLNVAEPSTVSPPDRRRIGPAPTRPSLESHNKLGPAPISRRAWLYPKSFKCIEVLQMLVCPY